jgi:multicomponent Na+:H+ antiporter subunit E
LLRTRRSPHARQLDGQLARTVPAELRFSTGLESRLARVVLANSITLVPGTMTMTLNEDEFVVHALTPAAADDLLSARMQNMIGSIFLEEPEPPPEVAWEPAVRVRP